MWAEIFVEWFLDRIYDNVEDRFGRAAAWLVTLALALAIIAALVTILVAVF